jgi:hypothetical protein
MRSIILTITFLVTSVFGEYKADLSAITPDIQARMIKGNSWRKGCPIPLKDLHYLHMIYKDFSGTDKTGELIVHKDVAIEVTEIFKSLYKIDYPIRKMKLVSHYKGNDWQSIEADNTSAFNCRNATGSKKWSKHSYGKAIDINPIENPYISRKGYISHKASSVYKKRVHTNGLLQTLKKLKSHNIDIEIDDFGTGYTSLQHLAYLPIDTLKIDRSFVSDLDKDGKKKALFQAIVDMANALSINVIAEGVENSSEDSIIKQFGSIIVQGYFYSKPVAIDQLIDKLVTN